MHHKVLCSTPHTYYLYSVQEHDEADLQSMDCLMLVDEGKSLTVRPEWAQHLQARPPLASWLVIIQIEQSWMTSLHGLSESRGVKGLCHSRIQAATTFKTVTQDMQTELRGIVIKLIACVWHENLAMRSRMAEWTKDHGWTQKCIKHASHALWLRHTVYTFQVFLSFLNQVVQVEVIAFLMV